MRLIALLSLLAVTLTTVPVSAAPPSTVPFVNVTAYLGRWYQVYADPVVTLTFEQNAVCVTADYGVAPDGKTITVFNQNRIKTIDGPFKNISGTAVVPDATKPGQLTVSLSGVPVPAPYWILNLGPFNVNDQYDYSIVSDPYVATLFVLTRDVARFNALYDADVRNQLKQYGFTQLWNTPQATVQAGCTYSE